MKMTRFHPNIQNSSWMKGLWIFFTEYLERPDVRRCPPKIRKTNADVFVTEKGSIHHTREEFLVDGNNKEQLIKLFSVALTQYGHQLIVCKGDADTHIVGEVIDLTCNKENDPVFAEDTDILIFLMHLWNSKMAEIFMASKTRKNRKGKFGQCEESRGKSPLVVKNLLFMHAWSGCDIHKRLEYSIREKRWW